MIKLLSGAAVMVSLMAAPAQAARFTCQKPGDTPTFIEFDSAAKRFTIDGDLDGKRTGAISSCASLKAVVIAANDGKSSPSIDAGTCKQAFGELAMVANYVGAIDTIDVVMTLVFDRRAMTVTMIGRIGTAALIEVAPCKAL